MPRKFATKGLDRIRPWIRDRTLCPGIHLKLAEQLVPLNLFDVSYPIIFILYKLSRMYRGFNMTNYYFAIYNFRNEKKLLNRILKYLKRAKDMIFNFSLKRNFDQRNKIIEIGGLISSNVLFPMS